MKNKNKPQEPISIASIGEVSTIVGTGTELIGKLNAEKPIRIDGLFNGDIVSTDTVIVGETGKIKGTVKCKYLYVGGIVEGTVETSEKLEIAAGGYINGEISSPNLVIDQGAGFDGTSRMMKSADGQDA
jgi:cytoskeletal protein CcmA (bactofilin family)